MPKRQELRRQEAPNFAPRLLAWFAANRRDLPWRTTRDPWAIWVSEVMLQQTRVEAVREPYRRFLQQFPTPSSFAAATDDELLSAWRGLGYYRRARLLRDGARKVASDHGGAIPRSVEALGELPGIGAYTRGAVASIAFGHPEPAIDGNVERVLARHRALRGDPKTSPVQREIRKVVLGWIDAQRAGDFNQALMELGATVCTPTSPACDRCPIAEDCRARREGLTAVLPERRPPRAAIDVTARVALILGSRGAVGGRIPEGQPNHGQIELPGAGILQDTAAHELAEVLRQRFAARIQVGETVASVRHAITHHRITLHAHSASLQALGQLAWFPLDDQTPWTTPSRKVFRAALGTSGDLRA